MGILDDAIREHLELKRQHGADDDELKQLEGEAFGPPERPGSGESKSDALAEAPTEFMAQPDTAEEKEADAASPQEPESGDIKVEKAAERSASRPDPKPGVADLQEAPEPDEEKKPSEPDQGEAVEETPAMEHKAIPDPESELDPAAAQGPSTEERQAIADPPTELYDVEGEEFDSEPQAPSDEELVEEEIGEPRLAPVEPLPSVEETLDDDEGGGDAPEIAVTAANEEEDEDDFFDEKRLSDELDQALDVPLEAEDLEPEGEPEPEEPGGSSSEEALDAPAAAQSEDILEDTPDFLEEAPEDDQLWFEQKPPKDFDFDD
jgi:hypothetical protein